MFEVLQIKFAPNSKFSKFKDETELTLPKSDASFYLDTLKTTWYIGPNPEDRINTKLEDQKNDQRTE